jgi:protein-disulfide isomerase
MNLRGVTTCSATRSPAAAVVLAAALALLSAACGGDSDGSPAAPSPAFPSGLLAGSTQVPALSDMLADRRIGPTDAPNVVIQYSSLGCSHCADFHQQGVDTYGVSGTPTFIVNGAKVVGNVPLAALTSYFQ